MELLKTLETLDDTRRDEVESWFKSRRRKGVPFITTSVDLRYSGWRLAPVDTNLFPAGFNNLSPAARARASRFFARYLHDHYANAKRMVIIPENHTRNLGYLDNLAAMLSIVETAGIDVKLGSLAAQSGQPLELESPSGRKLIQYPLTRQGDRVSLEDGFTPDLFLMNNDMTSGPPDILCSIDQPVMPPLQMGWWQRRKSVHFAAYKALAEDFGSEFDIDPWLLSAEFHRCGIVNFKEKTGLDAVAAGVDKVLTKMREKYKQYGISDAPFVYVKAESGTYGMGIMVAHAPEDILEINKKERNKMQVIKEGAQNSDVIIQEGIPTIDRIDGKPAEPMIYMVDGIPVGGMYRVNGERDAERNLNASGMEFKGMCDETEDTCGEWKNVSDCHFRAYGIIAAMAALAARREDYTVGTHGAGI